MEIINVNFDNYSLDQLSDLNRRLIDYMRLRDQRESQIKMHKFELGDIVCFESKYGEIVEGEIIRFNQKTVTIEKECGHQWRVSPSLLDKVIRSQEKQNNNIIDLPLSLPAGMGKNKPCPCGSGKKFKRCCINNTAPLFN